MKDQLISKFKHRRTDAFLGRQYAHKYAFVGIGQHSLSNLYPVLHYLQVPLKWIVVTSPERAKAIEAKFQGVKATANLDDVLSDPEVAAVFVAASPKAHFEIGKRVIKAGKWLFVEKPPCSNIDELRLLSAGGRTAVGLQKRYAPATMLLKRRLRSDQPLSYTLHYRTGAYPEGDALLDLFIHPLDLVTHLFGKGNLKAFSRSAGTLHLMLEHEGVTGILELSTDYSWSSAHEQITVVARGGVYTMSQMEELTFEPRQKSVMGVPLEKVLPLRHETVQLLSRNNFAPTLPNNQVYSQGFFNEIDAFVETVEGRKATILTHPEALLPTYELIESVMSC